MDKCNDLHKCTVQLNYIKKTIENAFVIGLL